MESSGSKARRGAAWMWPKEGWPAQHGAGVSKREAGSQFGRNYHVGAPGGRGYLGGKKNTSKLAMDVIRSMCTPNGIPRGAGWILRALPLPDQLRDHTGQKRRYWLVLKEIIRAAPCFFCVCWHGTSKQYFRSKNFAPRSWWSCSATASGSRATHGGTFYPHP
jgi:hypothetical protein